MVYFLIMIVFYFNILESSAETRFTVGYIWIACFIAWMVANVTFILWQTLIFAKTLLRRQYLVFSDRKLSNSVALMSDKLTYSLNKELAA